MSVVLKDAGDELHYCPLRPQKSIICPTTEGARMCGVCGWNQDVEERRILKLRKRRQAACSRSPSGSRAR